ncbi:MAG: polyprenyl synthetase family protein [Nitrospirae bacterium]|nr:polyprenyl synthetase family protein [Nitrospirota bacterium]
MPFDLKRYLRERKETVDTYLMEYLSRPVYPVKLHEAMKYSLFAGGKRIRPILCIAAYEACGGEAEHILPQASAIELIHTYSLIHDDLPAMDDDDLRRGKPTSHKVFGEAMAILAGDALLTEAFVMFTQNRVFDAQNLIDALRELAEAAGPFGMVGGQAEDIISENKEPDPKTLHFIHTHKTGALIRASITIAPILAGAPRDYFDGLSAYGEKVGLAFQIVDDILDVVGEEDKLGKKTGSDKDRGKITYPALYGLERSKAAAEELIMEAIHAIEKIERKDGPLKAIAEYILERME